MKKIIPFLFSLALVSCANDTDTKTTPQPLTTVTELDTLMIGSTTYFTQNLNDTNYTFKKNVTTDTTDLPAIKACSAFVERKQDSLFFTCDNGNRVKLVNNNGEEEYTAFDFIELNKDIDYYVVRRSLTEGRNYILISKKTGLPIETIGLPVVSPDKKYFVCGNCDLMAAFDFNGLEIYKAHNQTYKPAGKRELQNWGPENMTWKNDTTLIIKGTRLSNDKMDAVKMYMAIYIH